MPTHTIRLRGSWAVTAAGGRTRHARRFGTPRLPDPGERVWLVVGHVPGPAEIALNGEPVGTLAAAGPVEIDVTDRLRPRNEVAIDVASADPLGEVGLEIRG